MSCWTLPILLCHRVGSTPCACMVLSWFYMTRIPLLNSANKSKFPKGPTDNQELMKNKGWSQPNDQTSQKDNDHKQVAKHQSLEEGPFWCELHHENDTHNTGDCKILKRQAQAMCHNYETHKKAFKSVTKKHVSFKPHNFFQKKDQEEQHWLEAIVESILNKRQQTESWTWWIHRFAYKW